MKNIDQQEYVGERPLFNAANLNITNTTFADGESPLKEGHHLTLEHDTFEWKYPLWYCADVSAINTTLLETARSGIWYTHNIDMKQCLIEAPKTFRRASGIHLTNVQMPIALETLWSCDDITLDHVSAKGDYFGMNSQNIVAHDFQLSGNYSFDGGRNIEIHNATMLSKDAFWNCENVTVYDSTIIGEYLGWNSKNITFINCRIESEQGLCYIDNLVMKNCSLIKTNLAFEYSSVHADITTKIDSVKNPVSGEITAPAIGEIILQEDQIDPSKTTITETGVTVK